MKLAKLFNKFISSKFQYESKVNERFELKTKKVSLNNFDKTIKQYKDKFLEIFLKNQIHIAF